MTGALLASEDRQAEVSQRGAQVMPFNLDATTHVFTKTASGGVQQVVAKDPHDSEQIELIRHHLNDIAGRFVRGDFSGPTETHGAQMPGLAELKKATPGQITIRYQDLADGGQIAYSTQDPALVTAIHRWFDAQLSDHGHDAMAGHQHNHSATQ